MILLFRNPKENFTSSPLQSRTLNKNKYNLSFRNRLFCLKTELYLSFDPRNGQSSQAAVLGLPSFELGGGNVEDLGTAGALRFDQFVLALDEATADLFQTGRRRLERRRLHGAVGVATAAGQQRQHRRDALPQAGGVVLDVLRLSTANAFHYVPDFQQVPLLISSRNDNSLVSILLMQWCMLVSSSKMVHRV